MFEIVDADTKLTQSVPTARDPARSPGTRCWARDSHRQWWVSQKLALGSKLLRRQHLSQKIREYP